MDEDPIHKAFQQARNNYSEVIRTTKAEHWVEWLESLDGEEVWSVNQLVTGPASDGGEVPSANATGERPNHKGSHTRGLHQ